jgi:tetratricopeptide (TPR) repeat protein
MAAMSSSSHILLQQANALQQQGNSLAAEPLYRAVLAAQPTHDEAAHNLGLLLAQRGADAESLPLFQAALKVRPGIAQYWLSYAHALLSTDHAREARIVLTRAQQSGFGCPALDGLLAKADAALTPSDADRRMETGAALTTQAQIADAIAAYRDALLHAPDHAETHFRLGSLLSETGHVAEGFTHFMRRAALVHAGPTRWQNKPAPEYRLKHDREQAEYLAGRGVDGGIFFLEDGARLCGPAINPANAAPQFLDLWQTSWPQMIVLENFLTPEALEKLRRYCAGSTIWKRNYEAGYIGATPEDGLACPLMAQIAEEIGAIFPNILGGHHFHYLGAFKYDSTLSTGTNTHVDNSAVNVNFYIAPDEANLDPESGGMDIWDLAVPAGEDMRIYNSNESAATNFLEKSQARLTRVPHRANRAVIFKSDLFHKTSDCHFTEGYLNKRINVSLLFGNRGADTGCAGR